MHYAVLVAAVLAIGPAHALSKKTFCTITINSSDEREVLRKNLPADQWEIKELVPENWPEEERAEAEPVPAWLAKACQENIQCDALLISGHFGGTFFGKSGFQMSLEQMERASCHQVCAGIFKRPKEVFLMGCNTLAGKGRDRRTPEQYLQALLADGMERSRAEQTVALRYSPWGDKNLERMSNVFSSSAKIYGFDSIGPSGQNAAPMMSSYIKPLAANYASRLDKLSPTSPQNKEMKAAFRDTSFVESTGRISSASTAICYLEDEKISFLEKVRYVERELLGPTPMRNAPAIATWVKENQERGQEAEAEPYWQRIALNTSLREQFFKLIDQSQKLPSIEVQLIRFARNLRWYTEDQFNTKMSAVFEPYFADGKITIEERDALCSAVDATESVRIDYQRLGIRDLDPLTAYGLVCVGTIDRQVVRTLEYYVALGRNPQERSYALGGIYAGVLTRHDRSFSSTILKQIMPDLPTPNMRAVVINMIFQLGGFTAEEWKQIAEAVSASKEYSNDLMAPFFYAPQVPGIVFKPLVKRLLETGNVNAITRTLTSDLLVMTSIVYSLAHKGPALESFVAAVLENQANPQMALFLRIMVQQESINDVVRYEIVADLAKKLNEGPLKELVEDLRQILGSAIIKKASLKN